MTTLGYKYWILYTKYAHAHIYKWIVCLPTKWEALTTVVHVIIVERVRATVNAP